MRLENAFAVEAPPERTWAVLLDVPRVARALPGAAIEPRGRDGAWRGTMTLKLGPVTTEYAGTARLQDADDDERVASFRVQGREVRGQGTASATITSRLTPEGAGTRVAVVTELQVTGRQAQFGRSLMEDVAGALLGAFAAGLERELRGEPPPAPAAGGDALDLGAAVSGALLERAAIALAGVVVGLALGRVVWRR
ncbi:MAG TPA: SRPBCC family protein [Capillimicrobium sp.]|nr:SRPBCC family protein [Capillimicrobium sp.]